MDLNKTQFDLPNTILITELEKKLSSRGDNFGIKYMGILAELKEVVSQEVSYINKVFPEYTPHNNDFHFKNLFRIADIVLGEDLIKKMNAVELYILVSSIYCHDWGMAVSEDEKNYIISGEVPSSRRKEEFSLINEESSSIQDYISEVSILKDSKDITDNDWSEYVRLTHALRSGERAKKFFEINNNGLGEAIRKVCIGHWMDFSEIRNQSAYPTNYSVLNETVNLRALAVYIRLIDLLDLTEERTPFVLWKFASPKDSFSKMEWKKHRALSSVTCPSYQDGRIIKIDGHTDTPEVYAALEDLQQWVNEQFRGCNDLLSEMNHSIHKLNIYHIDWNIIAQGFSPISISFNFERERMFEILGDEIYQNDKFVFLRELLQNSVDAIRMRKEIIKKQKIQSSNFGEINIKIEEDQESNLIITWRDNGIGMNEYIIKNYFSVAGRSYYNSKDFRKEGLNLDPISRFGIGFLSCSTVADYVEIETFRDPYIEQDSSKLKIIIPSFKSHFQVRKITHHMDVGTAIKLFINKKKFDHENVINAENIITYLSVVGGFVEFPIIIEYKNRKAVIIHPYTDEKRVYENYGNDIDIKQLKFDFDWEKSILIQDVQLAKDHLSEKIYSIEKDLNLDGYQGAILTIQPSDSKAHIYQSYIGYQIMSDINNKAGEIRTTNKNAFLDSLPISPSSSVFGNSLVYIDGILVSDVFDPFDFRVRTGRFVSPQMIVNIPKEGLQYDLARTKVLNKDEWYEPIMNAYTNKVISDFESNNKEANYRDFFVNLAKIIVNHCLEVEDAIDKLNYENIVLPFILPGGDIEFQKLTDKNTLFELPNLHSEYPTEIGNDILSEEKKNTGVYMFWEGTPDFLITKMSSYNRPILRIMDEITNYILQSNYFLKSLKFLTPPLEGTPCLISITHEKKKNSNKNIIDSKSLLELVKNEKNSISAEQIHYYNNYVLISLDIHFNFPIFISFSDPYNEKLAFGFQYINVNHVLGRKIMSLVAHLVEIEHSNLTDKITLALLKDSINKLSKNYHVEDSIFYPEFKNNWNDFIDRIMKIIPSGAFSKEDFNIDFDDFIPLTASLTQINSNIGFKSITDIKGKFGYEITN